MLTLLVFYRTTKLFGIPYTVIFAFAIVVIFFLIMKYTTFGRNGLCHRLKSVCSTVAGINSRKYLFFVYLFAGILCGIAGVIVTSRSVMPRP